jgi:magnesium transporter
MSNLRAHERAQAIEQIAELLKKLRALEAMTHRQEGPKRDILESLQHRQNLAILHNRIRGLHPADLANVLESLPLEDRLLVWAGAEPRQAGPALVEASRSVRESLVAGTPADRLLLMLQELDAEDLAFVAPQVPPQALERVYESLDAVRQQRLTSRVAYPEGMVGAIMTSDLPLVRDQWSIAEALSDLRGRSLPPQTDAVFVTDVRGCLRGALPVRELLVRAPEENVGRVAQAVATFTPEDSAGDAAKAFERYDLVSAPVVDERGKPIGRVTVDAVLDVMRREAEIAALKQAGLAGEEDLFAPVWESARNRWLWLAVNLVTAFVASRVIGWFESAIAQLVALAALMPIVASVGGNTGNQTVALVIRGLALERLSTANLGHLMRKELSVGLMNGVVWGGVMGLFALVVYGNLALSGVMAAAILLNLLVAAVVGVGVPILLHRSGRDPAQGASVLLTFTTDAMGFLIFLGLARALLL